jgi:hypothetical protein
MSSTTHMDTMRTDASLVPPELVLQQSWQPFSRRILISAKKSKESFSKHIGFSTTKNCLV